MADAIPVNLPQVGDATCDECGAPGGVHKGSCWTAERKNKTAPGGDVFAEHHPGRFRSNFALASAEQAQREHATDASVVQGVLPSQEDASPSRKDGE